MPNLTSEGQNQVKRFLVELDEMQSYLNPAYRKPTEAYTALMQNNSRKKLHEVLNFLTGKD